MGRSVYKRFQGVPRRGPGKITLCRSLLESAFARYMLHDLIFDSHAHDEKKVIRHFVSAGDE